MTDLAFAVEGANELGSVDEGEECRVCGYNLFSITQRHHVVPMAAFRAGKAHLSELQTVYLCPNCHELTHKIYGKNHSGHYNGPRTVEGFVEVMKQIVSLEPWRVNYGPKAAQR